MGGGEEEASTTARSLRKAVGRLEATHTLFLRSVYLQCSSCLLLLHPYTAQGPTSTTQRQGIALGLIDSSSPIHSALDDGVPWVEGAKGSTKNYSTHPQQLQFSLAYSSPSLSFALWTAFVCHGMSVGMRACTRRRGGIGTTGGMLVTWPLFLGSVDTYLLLLASCPQALSPLRITRHSRLIAVATLCLRCLLVHTPAR